MRVKELAERLGCRFEGNGKFSVFSIASLASAGPTDLAFVAEARLAPQVVATRAGAVLVGDDFVVPPAAGVQVWLRCAHPMLAAAAAVAILRPPWRPEPGIHPTASIHPSAQIGDRCHVGAFVAIGEGCQIGADSVLHPHVVVYPNVIAAERLLAHAHVVIREGTRIGCDVVLQPGVVVGGDGFGFTRREDGTHAKIPQVGHVVLGDRVEIQANSCVDRASLDTTHLGDGCIVDSLVQIAHNCELAENVILCAQVGLAGHTRIGAGAVLAGQVGVAGHCDIGAGVVITAQSGTHGDLEAGRVVSGSPAFDHAQWLRATAAFARLGEMQRELREIRHALRKLAGNQA